MPGDRSVTLTGTIGLAEDLSQTRSLTSYGKKFFEVGETIAVVYTNNSDVTVKAVSEPLAASDILHYGKKAVIRVTLTDAKPNGALMYIYPAIMAKADGSVNYDALNSQDGTITSISTDLDLCTFSGFLTAEAELPEDANLANGLAICELTVNNASIDITDTLTELVATDGTNTYTVTLSGPTSPIYLALRPVNQDMTLSFTAQNDVSETFLRDVTGKILYPSHLYPINLRMNRLIDISTLTVDYQARKDDWLTGTLAENVKISIADNASISLCNVDINSSGTWTTGDYAGITCTGNATVTLVGTNNVTGFAPSYPAIYFPKSKRLTIQGTGSLIARNNGGDGAGIGGVGLAKKIHCGLLTIAGGTITAYGGEGAAGIGAGKGDGTVFDSYLKYIDNITISGGTVVAYGGEGAAGIGGGYGSRCWDISITNSISSVTAVKGTGAKNCIGKGSGTTDRRTISIGGTNLSAGDLDSPSFTSKVYGNLNVAISATSFAKDTWTVTPKL